MKAIPTKDLEKISYLETAALAGRVVNLMPFWDGERWHLWVPGAEGLEEIIPADAVEVNYVAERPAEEFDLLIPFVDLMWQRASYRDVCPRITAICEDFHNMGTSIEKLKHFFMYADSIGSDHLLRFATTELEYLVTLTRAVFDLLQETITFIWQNVRLKDPESEARRKGQKLPDTFSRLVLDQKKSLRTPQQVQDKFGLSANLAAEYVKHAAFFSKLRDIRDTIVHGGNDIGIIYPTESGFCVDPKAKPFDSLAQWNDGHYYNEKLVSILPWVGNIVHGTIEACNALVGTLASEILFPPPLAPGFHVFFRGPSTRALSSVIAVQQGGSPWWSRPDEDE